MVIDYDDLEEKPIISKSDQIKAIAQLDLSKKKTKSKPIKKQNKIVIDASLIPANLRELLNAIN